jgi:acetolactate synthase-1/3 small subunit
MHHTLVALVEDKPGVLNRVASLFRRRAFNIESLAVGHTSEPGISRMTIVIDSDQSNAERVIAYLYKLVNVIHIEDLGSIPAVSRELALVKVRVNAKSRAALTRLAKDTGLLVVDTGEETITFQVSGDPVEVTSTLESLEQFGVIAVSRTGQVAMRRGDTALTAAQFV